MPTLRERLTGQTPPAIAETPVSSGSPTAEEADGRLNGRAKATPASPQERLARSFTPRRLEVETLSPVDQLKVDLHRKLLDRLDLDVLEQIDDDALLATQIRQAVAESLRSDSTPLTQAERDDVIEQIVYEVTGLGPIEPFFRDPSISDILVNGPGNIYIERHGRLARVPVSFRSD